MPLSCILRKHCQFKLKMTYFIKDANMSYLLKNQCLHLELNLLEGKERIPIFHYLRQTVQRLSDIRLLKKPQMSVRNQLATDFFFFPWKRNPLDWHSTISRDLHFTDFSYCFATFAKPSEYMILQKNYHNRFWIPASFFCQTEHKHPVLQAS